jgi:hypothetical protein
VLFLFHSAFEFISAPIAGMNCAYSLGAERFAGFVRFLIPRYRVINCPIEELVEQLNLEFAKGLHNRRRNPIASDSAGIVAVYIVSRYNDKVRQLSPASLASNAHHCVAATTQVELGNQR